MEQFTLVDEDEGGKHESYGDESEDDDSAGDVEDDAGEPQDGIRKQSKGSAKNEKRKEPRMFEIGDAGEVLGRKTFSKAKARPSREAREKSAAGDETRARLVSRRWSNETREDEKLIIMFQ